MFRAVQEFQIQFKLETPNDAVRALVDIALRDMVQLDVAFRKAAWRYGVRSGAKELREKMDAAVAAALGVDDPQPVKD